MLAEAERARVDALHVDRAIERDPGNEGLTALHVDRSRHLYGAGPDVHRAQVLAAELRQDEGLAGRYREKDRAVGARCADDLPRREGAILDGLGPSRSRRECQTDG